MYIFFLFALFSTVSSLFVPLSTFGKVETLYKVNKTTKLFVISNSPQSSLESLAFTTDSGKQTINGFTLAAVQTDGSLNSFVPSNDNDYLSIVYSGDDTLSGYFYLVQNDQSNLNVFPLLDNSNTVQFKQGTNLFFRLENPNGRIPVAENVVIGGNSAVSAFTGLPDDNKKVVFFDSSSINGVSTYNQLELPLEKFHFVSTGNDIKYEIRYSQRANELSIGSSGLLMTDNYPSIVSGTKSYQLNNPNNISIEISLVPRFDASQSYGGNVTLFYTDANMSPLNFEFNSTLNQPITSNSAINRVVVETDGPYSLQYYLKDTTVTTPSPFETSTKSTSLPQIICSFLAIAALRF